MPGHQAVGPQPAMIAGRHSAVGLIADLTVLLALARPSAALPIPVLCVQRELSSKVQRIDALQAELNATQADKAAAEAAAAEVKDKAAHLQSTLAQAQRQVDILNNTTDSKETQLQKLQDELKGANTAKAALELQVGRLLMQCCVAARRGQPLPACGFNSSCKHVVVSRSTPCLGQHIGCQQVPS